MSLPHARYIVLEHEGVWKINLDNRYYGPFATREAAVESATGTAQKAGAAGYPASVLLMRGTDFETLWTSAPEKSG
ncbi:hypothetical protein Sphch_1569 [Sphingobium chlorophenolicum L-1]|uniref:DUF2188 domain-containing protein n=1 Tax=Sphingobium chlorophenolicum L-1 TaxID=690566 RepID=F6EZ16_SPHCR|nr:hypothetical protein [Sphingobium chlorophenolicum]AEG49257.1 hypothetical protein Sphch_1569 [Sphingobium chlorophenolicum L-1]